MTKHGVPKFQEERPPVPAPLQLLPHTSLKPRLIRAPRTKALETIFSEHARDGFVYWVEEDKVKGGGCGECCSINSSGSWADTNGIIEPLKGF